AHRAWSYDASSFAFAYMPAATDWIYTFLYIIAGELAAKLFNFAALMLLCGALYVLLREVAPRKIALWVLVALASMPIAFLETATLFIEHALALWITCAVGIIVVARL